VKRIQIDPIEGLSAFKLSHIVSHLRFVRPNLRGQQRPDKVKKAVLRALCDRYPTIWPSLRDIADKASCSEAQARRVLRELEYKDRLIVDANSRMEWRWPCECEDKRKCGHRASLVPITSGKSGGRGKNCTPQYVINDRRIVDIHQQQEAWEKRNKTQSSENAEAHSSQGVQKRAATGGENAETHSSENKYPLTMSGFTPKPTHHECRTYHSLTDQSITDHGGQPAKIAALPEPTTPPLESAGAAKKYEQDRVELKHLEGEVRREQLGDNRVWRITMLTQRADALRVRLTPAA
jgi:hypothetical protein